MLFLAQLFCQVRARRVPPERVGRDDRVGRLLEDAVAQRSCYAAFRRFDVLRPNIFQALLVAPKPDAPLGLDRAGRSLVEPFSKLLSFALGEELESSRCRGGSSRIAVSIERHVGQTAVRGDRCWLSFRALEWRHIGRRSARRNSRNAIVLLDGIDLAHGMLPVENIESWRRGLLVFSVYHTPNDVASIAPLSISTPESELLFEWTNLQLQSPRAAILMGKVPIGLGDSVGLQQVLVLLLRATLAARDVDRPVDVDPGDVDSLGTQIARQRLSEPAQRELRRTKRCRPRSRLYPCRRAGEEQHPVPTR